MSNVDQPAETPDYLKTFSLKCEPFANDLDGRFFYGGSALMQRLDLLTHLTQFGDAVVLVSGPPGSGKTTLLSRFAAQANKQWRLCLINADEFGEFQQRLGDTLRVSGSGDEQQLLEQWINETDNSQLLVIVIDNAEQLPEDAFEKLCTLLNQSFSERLRLVLFGTPEAQLTLKQALDRKNLDCTSQLLEVPRLSEEETASYLMYRLAVAGYSGESPFTATEVRGMCKAADGRPAEINLLARESLLERQARISSKRPKSTTGERKVGALFWGPASLLVIGAATYLGWERLQPTTPIAPVAEIPLPVPPAPVAEVKPAATVALPQQAPAVARVGVDQPQPVEPAMETPVDKATEAPVAAISPAPPATIQPPPADSVPDSQPSTATPPEPPTATAEMPAVVTPSAAPADTPATAAKAATPVDTEKAVPAPDEAPPAAPASTPPVTGTTGPHHEAWLLQQDETAFSLQLLGSRSEKSIRDFIKRNDLDPGQAAYYRGNYRGGEWYVLIYGIYADKASALAARDALPAKVRADKPWPRSLESVQKAILEMQ